MGFADEPPLSFPEMAVVERNAVALGISLDNLMENAGRASAEEAARHLHSAPARVGIVAGPGNNGGDGFAAAYYLGQWGFSPEIWLIRPPTEVRPGPARRCFDRASSQFPVHVGVPQVSDLAPFPLLIDAMLGTGQAGEPRGPFRAAVEALNQSKIPTLSIDLPTGLGSPVAVQPQWTIALTTLKSGMSPEVCGEIAIRDIGIPFDAWRRTGAGEFEFLRVLPPTTRARASRVLVVGGGPYAGAPALTALAALRAGCERATIVAPEPAASIIRGFSPNLITEGVGERRFGPSDLQKVLAFADSQRFDAVALGMGVGSDAETARLMGNLVNAWAGNRPLLVDAEALSALSGATKFPAGAPVAATPNTGEYSMYFGAPKNGSAEERLGDAQMRAAARGVVLVVKGQPDMLTDGHRAFFNFNHASGQAVGGAGDVLDGVLVAGLALGIEALDAARLATYWVGEAGNRAAQRLGIGLLATDIVDEIAPARVASTIRELPAN